MSTIIQGNIWQSVRSATHGREDIRHALSSIRQATLIGLVLCAVPACRQTPSYEVHRAVSATVDHFAPGLSLSTPVKQNAPRLGGNRWVQHVGLVGTAPRGLFVQARLYPELEARNEPSLQGDAPVRVIELLADNSSNDISVMSDLMIAFRGIPKEGCVLVRRGETQQLRQVRYWAAPKGAGGVAVVSDFNTQTPVWSLVAWSGPFNGTETLMAPFEPRQCDGGNEPIAMPNVAKNVAAVSALQIAFSDSVHGVRTGAEDARHRELTNADAPDACVVPEQTVETTRYRLSGYSIEVPSDFVLVRKTSPHEWRAPDNSMIGVGIAKRSHTTVTGGNYKSSCETTIGGRRAIVSVVNLGATIPELGVTTAFPMFPEDFVFDASGPTQARQRQLLRAAYSIQIDPDFRLKITPDYRP